MKQKYLFGKKWFFEEYLPDEPKHTLFGIALKKQIVEEKSPYQTIEVVDTEGFGRVLLLDGFIQLSTKYEKIYHEMLVHLSLCSHPNPKTALIIGGGDGGALREVLKHPVKEVFLVEIDKKVIDIARRYLPSVSQSSFQDPRVKICIQDGKDFVQKYKNYFDCIILDSNDPDGKTARPLFKRSFFVNVLGALKKDGIFAAQTGYVGERFGQRARKLLQNLFPFTKIYRVFVKSFPEDEHSFTLCSPGINFNKLTQKTIQKRYQARRLRTVYYSPLIHIVSGVFPHDSLSFYELS